MCVLCQNITDEHVRCPNDTKRSDVEAGYKSLATSLAQFNEIGALPPSVRLSQFDDGDGIEASLCSHSAKWHRSCRNLYNKTKLDRALKRKHAIDDDSRDKVDIIDSDVSIVEPSASSTARFTWSSASSSASECC